MLKSLFQNKDSRFLTAVQHLNRVSQAFRQPLEFDHHFWAALTPWFDLEPWQSDNLVWLKHFVSKWFYNLNVAWPLVSVPRRLCSLQLHIVLPAWGRNLVRLVTIGTKFERRLSGSLMLSRQLSILFVHARDILVLPAISQMMIEWQLPLLQSR